MRGKLGRRVRAIYPVFPFEVHLITNFHILEPDVTTPPPTAAQLSMYAEFRAFLLETNALALAIGVVIGAAVGKLVSTIVQGLIMPIIGLVLPGGNWRAIRIPLDGDNAILVGEVLGAVLDFLIIAWVVFLFAKKILRMKPPTK
jgi:large conductance mechanosensitive channel